MGVPISTSKFWGSLTASPVTVVIREINGRPVTTASMHGHCAANILADHAHVRGQPAAGHLLAGEYFDQLFLAARRVFGGKLHDLDARVLAPLRAAPPGPAVCCLPHRSGFPAGSISCCSILVPVNNLVGALAHQHVIGGDIWLAFGAIDNQGCRCGFPALPTA